MTMKETLVKGIIGVAAPVGGAVISALQSIEAWLRVGSLCVGITVGIVTIWSLIKKTK